MTTGVASPLSSKLRAPSELIGWAGANLTDMASLFGAACREYQARPAYRVDGTWITYADCGARVSRIASSLRSRLVQHRQATGKQPTIAVLLPNSHRVLELFYTAAATDSILFPLNHRLSPAEIEAGLRATGPAETVQRELDAARARLRRALPSAHVVEIPGGDHAIFRSHPERVIQELRAFLARYRTETQPPPQIGEARRGSDREGRCDGRRPAPDPRSDEVPSAYCPAQSLIATVRTIATIRHHRLEGGAS